MKLSITSVATTMSIEQEVVSVRAMDASGYFGIHRGHADFLTVLDIGVISWIGDDKREHFCAVRGGILRVKDGNSVEIVSREAIIDDDATRLESTIMSEFRRREEAERSVRFESKRLELQMVREIMRYLRPENLTASKGTYDS